MVMETEAPVRRRTWTRIPRPEGGRGRVVLVAIIAWTAAGSGCDDLAPEPVTCAEVSCPAMQGYGTVCNFMNHCEYLRLRPTEEWHAHDIWIYVPPGSFWKGAPDEITPRPAEGPQRWVSVGHGFFIQKFPLTVRTHDACRAASACDEATNDPGGYFRDLRVNRSEDGHDDHPRNSLDWYQARDACSWLGGRLLSEAEWEYAANGPGRSRPYPWGDAPEPSCDNDTIVYNPYMNSAGRGCREGGTHAVGGRLGGRSPVGALDMLGNVGEWVEDCWHDTLVGAPTDGQPWTDYCYGSPEYRVFRGSHGFLASTSGAFTHARVQLIPTARYPAVGVRCARDVR